MPKKKILTIAGVVYTLLFAGAGAGIADRDSDTKCGGVERWEQKVLIDDRVPLIKKQPKLATIEEMNAVVTDTVEITKSTERTPLEMQVYEIRDCFITKAILESDNDIHLVIEDGKGHTMIAEIPDTKCKDAKSSAFADDFRNARKTFRKFQNVYDHHRFTITGVLFIDKQHSKPPTGNADNNVELHPVLDLQSTSQF
jgi:hypothetical protein